MVRIPQSTSGVEWAEDSFHSAKFGRDSRASFADYGEEWCHSFLCLYQVTTFSCSFQVKREFLAYTRSRCFLVYTRSRRFLACTRSQYDSLFIPGEVCYSHQCPGCGVCFLDRYTAEEQFLGCLREWRLGDRDPRLWDGFGQRVVPSRPVSGMSKTVGGRSVRLTAAASGGAVSISSLVSGQAASGWGCTGPGVSPPAILSSRVDQSMIRFCLGAQRAIQRRSLNEIAEEQVRRGQIRRRSLDEI